MRLFSEPPTPPIGLAERSVQNCCEHCKKPRLSRKQAHSKKIVANVGLPDAQNRRKIQESRIGQQAFEFSPNLRDFEA
ncbi:hypothetical protein [uncultured Rhodoblastus sp.]|uniref:hypothetical protein n=1 Tax=uncultured Rhodoblastus sp. TaxID=543037 RepID=UPI0025DA137C|nr:hypothetical protein [uncultured Rhodoblastus sp.]